MLDGLSRPLSLLVTAMVLERSKPSSRSASPAKADKKWPSHHVGVGPSGEVRATYTRLNSSWVLNLNGTTGLQSSSVLQRRWHRRLKRGSRGDRVIPCGQRRAPGAPLPDG